MSQWLKPVTAKFESIMLEDPFCPFFIFLFFENIHFKGFLCVVLNIFYSTQDPWDKAELMVMMIR